MMIKTVALAAHAKMLEVLTLTLTIACQTLMRANLLANVHIFWTHAKTKTAALAWFVSILVQKIRSLKITFAPQLKVKKESSNSKSQPLFSNTAPTPLSIAIVMKNAVLI